MKHCLALILFCSLSWGACHVITPSGGNSNSGADWNNPCAGFTGNCSASTGMVRGDTYYLGKGTYTAPFVAVADSGATMITVKSPTASDHCTNTGFVQGTHVGQANMQGQMFITSGHWTWDGQYGTLTTNNEWPVPVTSKGSFGMKITGNASTDTWITCRATGACANSTFRFMEIQGNNGANCPIGGGGNGDVGIYPGITNSGNDNVLVEYDYIYQVNNAVKTNDMTGMTIQHTLMDENYQTAGCHGEPIGMNGTTNYIIRYNWFLNCKGTACISTPCGVCAPNVNVQIYGNLMSTDSRYNPSGPVGGCNGNNCLMDGLIGTTGSTYTGIKIYNNTIANWGSNYTSDVNLNVLFNSGGTITGQDLENNLLYNNNMTDLDSGGTCKTNTYISTTRVSSACTGDVTGSSTNPFVNSQSDFHLTFDVGSWTGLASPYNADPDGVTRTSSRGTFQFVTSGPTIPTVTTTTATSITTTTAASGGNVTSDGGATVTAYGVCYATTANPTSPCTNDGGGTGPFTSSLTGLTQGTLYHYRAFATNAQGTAYGSDLTFTTLTTATVTTTSASSITTTTASSGGTVTTDGGASVTSRGVCYATSANPTSPCTSDGSGTGSYTSSLTGLSPGTLYHYRAFATNSVGTSYGSDLTFTTNAGGPVTSATPAGNAVSAGAAILQ